MRRLLAAATTLLMAATLAVAGGAAPAVAAPRIPDVDVKIWSYLCDDEVIDRRDNCGEHRLGSRALKVPTGAGTWFWTACQGDEVWVHVELTSRAVAGGKVEVTANYLFLEAAFGCNIDIEGRAERKAVIAPGERAVMTASWGEPQRGHDGAIVQVILNDIY